MARRELHDVHPGQIWRDRDKREWSGNRRVRVTSVTRDGYTVTVRYQQCVGPNNKVMELEPVRRSKYDRFQRAFDFVQQGRR